MSGLSEPLNVKSAGPSGGHAVEICGSHIGVPESELGAPQKKFGDGLRCYVFLNSEYLQLGIGLNPGSSSLCDLCPYFKYLVEDLHWPTHQEHSEVLFLFSVLTKTRAPLRSLWGSPRRGGNG